MPIIDSLITGGVFGFLGKAIDKIFPDPAEKAKARALLEEAQVRGDIDRLGAELQVMLAEAKSQDKWTSRARPSFLYVMYTMILFSLVMGVVYAVNPTVAGNITVGVRAWLNGIPGELWTLFGVGYLGYTGAREYGKKKLVENLGKIATNNTP